MQKQNKFQTHTYIYIYTSIEPKDLFFKKKSGAQLIYIIQASMRSSDLIFVLSKMSLIKYKFN